MNNNEENKFEYTVMNLITGTFFTLGYVLLSTFFKEAMYSILFNGDFTLKMNYQSLMVEFIVLSAGFVCIFMRLMDPTEFRIKLTLFFLSGIQLCILLCYLMSSLNFSIFHFSSILICGLFMLLIYLILLSLFIEYDEKQKGT